MRWPASLSARPPPWSALALGVALTAALGLGAWLLWAGLIYAPGPHDNDFPLLMWLVKHASLRHAAPLAIGHYGPLELLLAWWLYPVFGSTLIATKVLNTFGAVLAALALYGMTRRHHGEWPALLVLAAFASSAPTLDTGQSEFADALAGALFLAGLWHWWRSEEQRGLLAGLLIGAAGLMRLHFVFFSIGCALLAALIGVALPSQGHSRGGNARAGLALIGGALLGNLPTFALNLCVHGRLTSPVASSFVGQVLYGFDEYDLLSSYDLHPFGEIVRDAPLEILGLMARRFREAPALWLVPLIALLVAAVRCTKWPALVLRHVLLVSGLALGYFVLFVTLSFWLSPRLLFPLTALECWLAVVVPAQLTWGTFRFSRPLLVLGVGAWLGYRWPETLHDLQQSFAQTRAYWNVSTELVRALRERGMQDPREAFVYDWNRFVVDDPQFQPFYDFGFWNLLLPEYRKERPLPTPYLDDLPALGRFFRDQGVRFLVLPRNLVQLGRFPELVRLMEGTAVLPGFRQEVDLAWDRLFVREP